MTGTDLVVVLPGILGSTLRHHGKLVWAPSGGSVLRAVATFGRSVTDLRLPDGIGDDHPGDGVEPDGLMPDLHVLPGLWTPVKGYDRLLDRLPTLGYHETAGPDAPAGNLLPVAYDWRLSIRYTGRWLATLVEPALERWRAQGGAYADARVVFVCHSMGGLVARWYVEKCGGAEITRKLITLGTPYRGAVKALVQLANGMPAALGPLADRFTGFAGSLPALYHLLPEYACLDNGGDLLKTTETILPGLDTGRVADAMRFHTALRDAEAARPASLAATHAIVGTRQPTASTARLAGGRVEPLNTYRGGDWHGDSTVPLVGAARADVGVDSNTLRRVPDKHGNLHRNRAALDEVEGILTAKPVVVRAPEVALWVDVPELVPAGQPLPIQVRLPDGERHGIRITVTDESGRLLDARTPAPIRGAVVTEFTDLPPGAHTIEVTGIRTGSPLAPITATTLIWP
ncbi:MAG TPA: hypothetical protein VFX70_02955 [Mycobacteriales bacterium]|nr:hypothetical protein [Mycobacteriales bacterium]